MAITARTLRLENQLAASLELVTDEQTRDLVRAWATAWDEVAPDLTAVLLEMLTAGERVTRTQLLRSARLRRVLAIIADHLTQLAAQAGVRVTGDLQAVITAAGGAQASIIDSQLPPGFMSPADVASWSRVDADQIAAIVQRSTEQITAKSLELSPSAYDAVRRELIRGVAAGSNPRETARRIVARTEGRFNGGLTRALVIARTETLDAHRAAAELGQAQHTDTLNGWVWLATLDTLTCRSCWGQHGHEHPLTEGGPYDHHQGRCARMPKTKTWAELGFDIEEPTDLTPDAQLEFAALPVADQKRILGASGYAAWARGEFPMDAWSVRRTTPGWRDSFHPAPVPQSGGRRSATAA